MVRVVVDIAIRPETGIPNIPSITMGQDMDKEQEVVMCTGTGQGGIIMDNLNS